MDFFDRQDRARRRTRWLVVWFLAAVAGVIAAVYLAVLAILVTRGVALGPWSPTLFGTVAVAVSTVIGGASVYKTLSLREGGAAVARLLGGRPLDSNTRNAPERRLLNVVEEMAIAAGVPVPEVFVLEREGGINAFAAGFTGGEAVIGVTRGAMTLLDREELQGVIAHEFSHILNGDMRLNLKLIGLLHGILVLSLIGYFLLRSGRFGGRRGAGVAILLFGVALWAIGSIGAFFARLIKSGISRQRELLADASAVQFTRNPLGLADALRKIGGLSAGSRLQTSQAEQASHLFFSDGMKHAFGGAGGMLATHPPLEERIRALDPTWDGTYPRVEAAPSAQAAAASGAASALAGAPASALAAPLAPDASRQPAAFDPHAASSRAGQILAGAIEEAGALMASLPEALQSDVREPAEAEAIIYALLLHPDEARRRRQIDLLTESAGERAAALLASVGRASRALRGISDRQRLPLVDLAMPALRGMSRPQYELFRQRVHALIDSDQELELFELALQRLLARHLAPRFSKPEASNVQYYSLRGLAEQCSVLLSALAHVGGRAGAAEAFAAGAGALGGSVAVELLPAEACELEAVDRALRSLALVAPRHKRALVDAISVVIAWDREVTTSELELLRAICDTLDVPIPPFERSAR